MNLAKILSIGILWVLMSHFPASAIAPDRFTVAGVITDEKFRPLSGATINILPVQMSTSSNQSGHFEIAGLPKGRYTILISHTGYSTYADTILIEANITLKISMQPMFQTLQEVVIRDHAAESTRKTEPLSSDVVTRAYLRQHHGGSLMKSLERLPGVSTIDIGSGQSKPVIRGLSFNRVVVMEHGIRHEGQQWGADHGLEIDQYATDRIEVVRGPASLMIGSDAIGGVIHLSQAEIQQKDGGGAIVEMTAKSNNRMVGTSLYLFGRKQRFYSTFRVTMLGFGDTRVPADSVEISGYRVPLDNRYLSNTAGNERNVHFSAGYDGVLLKNRIFVSFLTSKVGFFANAHGIKPQGIDTLLHYAGHRDILEPKHDVQHLKIVNRSSYQVGLIRFEADLGVQVNHRSEWSPYIAHGFMPAVFPEELTFSGNLERDLHKVVLSANLKGFFPVGKRLLISSGLSAENQKNNVDGRGFIIPEFQQYTVGGFLYGKFQWTKKTLGHGGVRFDTGALNTSAYFDWFQTPVDQAGDTVWLNLQRAPSLDRHFSSFTWSLGINHNLEQLSLKLNLGKSFRMPVVKELAANGVNYHQFTYEIGDPALDPEVSYQIDAGATFTTRKFAVEITPFFNYFPNYIYLNPGYEYDRLYGNGHQIFHYMQSRVLRVGGELHLHYSLNSITTFGVIGEVLYSEQLSGQKKGYSLPLSPPASVLFNIKLNPDHFGPVRQPYLSLDLRLVSPQNRIVPPEEKTPGYHLINVSSGGVFWWKKLPITASFQIRNLLNKRYQSHTSFYRLINVPEPGRSFILSLTMPFSFKTKAFNIK